MNSAYRKTNELPCADPTYCSATIVCKAGELAIAGRIDLAHRRRTASHE